MKRTPSRDGVFSFPIVYPVTLRSLDRFIYMAQTQTALAAAPKYSVSRVRSHPVRYGKICLSGLGCTTGGDSHCNARITFGNAVPERDDLPSAPFTDVLSERAGTTICQ